MTKLITIDGIGPTYADKLGLCGIQSINDLLDKASTSEGRRKIREETGISEKLILEWVNMADLMTIDGIGPDYADLLHAAGVDTKPDLALRSPKLLHEQLVEVNSQKFLVRRVPSEQEIAGWIKLALKSRRRISY